MSRIRVEFGDFHVEEIPLYRPQGEGAHTFVRVEKRGRTTEDVARAFARIAGVKPRDIGYAGRKDRVAIATQWFSVPGLDPARARELELPHVRVLEAERHPHKLRTGQLRGNRFRITVRDVTAQAHTLACEQLERLRRTGMPNRFGVQRFGRDGENVERAQRLLRGERVRGDRRAARFLFSALQAAVFNTVLTERPIPLDRLERGEIAMVHASGASFLVQDLEREAPRAAAFEISPTGPIFGSRLLEPRGEAAERERAALERFGIAWKAPIAPRGIRLRGARRALRVRPEDASAEAGDGVSIFRFSLPPGSYATVLIEELLGERFQVRG